MTIRTYSSLKKLKTFNDRYDYLRLSGVVGRETFGFDRYLNQMLYKSKRWAHARDEVIFRDEGCDLGMEGYQINDRILVHHMNPITIDDIEEEGDIVFNPEFLICTSSNTHLAIHYGDESLLPKLPIKRTPNDTRLW